MQYAYDVVAHAHAHAILVLLFRRCRCSCWRHDETIQIKNCNSIYQVSYDGTNINVQVQTDWNYIFTPKQKLQQSMDTKIEIERPKTKNRPKFEMLQ